MTESFLHYLWELQYFNKEGLQTTTGEDILVFHPGHRNKDAGPDFFNARLKIGAMEWIGSVEIHLLSSGWTDHKHHLDAAYANVILHVVWSDNKPVKQNDGFMLPTLELKARVDERLLLRYKTLAYNPEKVPCASKFPSISELIKRSMLDRALAERLEVKAASVLQRLPPRNVDWEETCYQLIARNFGFKVNAEPFYQLAKSLPLKFILKHGDKLLQVEALLFGQAGFLEEKNEDSYYQSLQREYRLLGRKYHILSRGLNKVQWRFLRLRPANFPSLRIAQLASLLFLRRNLFSSLLEMDSNRRFMDFFTVGQSEYWNHHYHFFSPWRAAVSAMGSASMDNIVINSVVPMMVAYGRSKGEEAYFNRAVRILQSMRTEHNSITARWKSLGMDGENAFDSQAMVELYNNFCLKRRCLECSIGVALVNPRRA